MNKLTQEIQMLIERIEFRYGHLHRSFKNSIIEAAYENRVEELVQIKLLLMQILETSQKETL